MYTGKIKYSGIIYDGIHEPIISEEIFGLAQKIHKNKLKNFRVYKNFLFGGLIGCKECKSSMSSHFVNKQSFGKLKRYYYYRCTSTSKQDWNTCKTKEVSADRIENFVLENLERISLDQNYIENLVFRLNHRENLTDRIGSELTQSCSKFSKLSPENISDTLKFFISELKIKKGIEKNLLAKDFIQKILYSPENIKITFKIRHSAERNGGKNRAEKCPSPPKAGWGENQFTENQERKNQFVILNTVPRIDTRQTFTLILPNLIHKSKRRNLNRKTR